MKIAGQSNVAFIQSNTIRVFPFIIWDIHIAEKLIAMSIDIAIAKPVRIVFQQKSYLVWLKKVCANKLSCEANNLITR